MNAPLPNAGIVLSSLLWHVGLRAEAATLTRSRIHRRSPRTGSGWCCLADSEFEYVHLFAWYRLRTWTCGGPDPVVIGPFERFIALRFFIDCVDVPSGSRWL
jgi:hypothetical protein